MAGAGSRWPETGAAPVYPREVRGSVSACAMVVAVPPVGVYATRTSRRSGFRLSDARAVRFSAQKSVTVPAVVTVVRAAHSGLALARGIAPMRVPVTSIRPGPVTATRTRTRAPASAVKRARFRIPVADAGATGVTATGSDAAPAPTALSARSRIDWLLPLTRPVTASGLAVPVSATQAPPSTEAS